MDRRPFILLLLVLIHVVLGCDKDEPYGYYKICLKPRSECTTVRYAAIDKSNGTACREACATGPASNTKILTAFNCPDDEYKSCKKYQITGRDGHAESFARHVKCVLACELVNSIKQEDAGYARICGCTAIDCSGYSLWQTQFDRFKKCWHDCSGWTNLEKTVLAVAYMCDSQRRCQTFYHYQKPGTEDNSYSLMQCMNECDGSSRF
nr:unnamed protein product [Spirometra erinaceieuropaei]